MADFKAVLGLGGDNELGVPGSYQLKTTYNPSIPICSPILARVPHSEELQDPDGCPVQER